jgi:hypothetical protein
MKCGICGKTLKRVKDLELQGFRIHGWKCSCGNTLGDPEDVNNIVKFFIFIKNGGKVQLFKTGNSMAIRIPKAIVALYHLKDKDVLQLDSRGKEIVLKVMG